MPSVRTRSILLAALAAGLTIGSGAVSAQGIKLGEQAEPGTLDLGAPAPAPAPTPAAPSAPAQPPAARPVDDMAPAPGGDGPLTRETFGAWEVACAENGQCAMAQIGNDESGTPVLEMVLRKLAEPLDVGDRTAIAVLDVVTPLGVVLTEGLGLTIDGGRSESAPFQICTEQGCLVREPVDADLISRLKRGSNATIEIVAASQGPITSTLSLSGFTKAFDTVE